MMQTVFKKYLQNLFKTFFSKNFFHIQHDKRRFLKKKKNLHTWSEKRGEEERKRGEEERRTEKLWDMKTFRNDSLSTQFFINTF